MIRHTVVFSLRHEPGSVEEVEFLANARELAAIEGVQRFEQLRQVSSKSDFAFSFSMEFEDEAAYTGYNEDPVHVEFVRTRWVAEVEKFQELDFVPL
ncbi:MAG: Dabb family protein [Propionibacteriaceae bacterium]